MADDAPEIKVRLTAEDTGVAAAIKELGAQLKNVKQQADQTASSTFNLTKALQGLAAAGLLVKLAQIGREAFDSAINIGNMAEKTGLATETLSVFHKVAGDVGVATEKVDTALVKGAKSITLFEAGSKGAAEGFALLGLKQKDFIGLNSDQKMQKVVEALGRMEPGLKKTTAAQLVFSKSGAEMIVVADQLAEQGFSNVTAETERLGLLLGGELVEKARVAKESLQDVKDMSVGLATQFEAGLLPAVADVAEALGQSMNAGDEGIEKFGEDVGNLLKFLAEGSITLGHTIGTVLASIVIDFQSSFERVKIEGVSTFEAIADAARGNLRQAFRDLADGQRDYNREVASGNAQQAAVYKQLMQDLAATDKSLFTPKDEQEAFAAADKATQDAIAALEDQKAAVRDRLLKGLITQQQAEKEIKDLLAQQVPLIEAKAKAELKYAEAQGHASQIARAKATSKQVTALTPEGPVPQLGEERDKVSPAAAADIKAQQEASKHQDQADSIARAAAASLRDQLQGELDIWKAYEKQREESEKDSYDGDRLTTEQYYARRREDLKAETASELAILRQELDSAKSGAINAAVNASSARAAQTEDLAKSQKAGPETKTGQAFHAEADRHEAEAIRYDGEHIAALAKVQELETKIQTTTIDGDTKSMALEREKAKAQDEDTQKELAFRKEIAELQGKSQGSAQEEIRGEVQARTGEAEKSATSPEDLAGRLAEIEQWKQLKLAVAAFDDAEKKEAGDQKAFDIEKQGIELQQKAGLLSRAEAEKKVSDLIQERLPLLIQEAEAELKIAQASGNQEQIAKAQELLLTLRNLSAETITWQHQLEKAGEEARTSITGDFTNLFTTLASGTKTAGQAFSQFGLSILRSLEQIAAQMLANIIVTKLLQTITSTLGIGGGAGKAQLAQTVATNDAMIVSNAGVAGAAAFASAMEVTPFPADIPTATSAMGTAISLAMSNLALGSAAGGAFLDEDKLIQAHAEEMILPRDISLRLREALIQRPAGGDLAGHPPIITPEIAAGLRAAIDPGGMTERGAAAGTQALPRDIGRQVSADLRSAVDSGALTSPTIAQPDDFRATSFKQPEPGEARGGDQHFHLPTHIGELKAWDGPSVRAALAEHGDLVGSIAVAAVKRHFRSNGVNK